MKTLGVTGGIGSGKSTVCRLFEELGARVFYADTEAREIMERDPQVRAEIIAAFGAESYHTDGSLNRPYLAGQIFNDAGQVRKINAIVHPRVFTSFEAARRQAEEEGVGLLIHEAALLFEAGGDRHLDAVAVVEAPEEVRVRRVVDRDGVTPEQVRARMRHQLPSAERLRRADYVIRNDGSVAALREQVTALYHTLTR